MFEREERISKGLVLMAVTRCYGCLNSFEFGDRGFDLLFIKVKRRQKDIGCLLDSEVVPQVEHVANLADSGGIVRVKADSVFG